MIVGGAGHASPARRHAAVAGASEGDTCVGDTSVVDAPEVTRDQRRRPWWVWVVPFVVTCAVLLARNVFLFSRSYYEDADMGANSILIEQARHFRLLVGDYSRLGFNHPGPAYLYVQAWGESLFYDVLHVVPAPWNGQVLAVYVLNSALVALAVAVTYGWTRSAAGPAACLAAFAGFAALHPMILSSDWMSYLYVVTYALFVIAAASVAAGRGREDAWIAVLAGWFLLHGHAAYLFFVPLLTAASVACALWRFRRALPGSSPRSSPRSSLRSWPSAARRSLARHRARHRATWVPVAVISAVFLLPIVINLALHWPGDFVQYFSYGSSSKSGGHPAVAVLRYVLWFWWPAATAPGLRVLVFVPVLAYAVAAGLAWWCTPGPVRRFLLTLLGLNLVSSVAFAAYAATGIDNLTPDGHYIGYFYWSAPLITLLVATVALAEALIPARVAARGAAAVVAVAVAAAAMAAFAAAPLSRTSTAYSDPAAPGMSPPPTDAAIPGAVAALAARSGGKTLVLGVDPGGAWEDLTGFLVQAERTGVRACVDDPAWEFMVTSQFICTPQEAAVGAPYYFHSTVVPERGQVITRMYATWVTVGPS
jgi:hypothetical protein